MSAESLLHVALSDIELDLRKPAIDAFLEVKKRHVRSLVSQTDFDALGLSAGKYCESVLRILQKKLTGTCIPFGVHVQNFADEVRKLVQLDATAGNESLRIVIPRALLIIYTVRGKRGIGHVAGDVDANMPDANLIATTCGWIMGELVRVFHKLSLEEAHSLVHSLNDRKLPLIWEIMGRKRVLAKGLTYAEKVLLLCYSATEGAHLVEDLLDWTRYSNPAVFKKNVLAGLSDAMFVEHDDETESVHISPLGIKHVETALLPKIQT